MSIWDAPRTPSFLNHQKPSEFDLRARARLGDPDAIAQLDPNDPDNIPAEHIKAAHNAALREDKSHQDRLETQANADAFIAGHPELKDSLPNARLLLNQARTMFGEDGPISVDQWEAAYQHLRVKTDFLAFNADALAKQQKEASRQRYADSRAAEANRIVNLSEQQLETMSLEDIRRLDAEERQRELQAAGERGGNGF
jgi:hypothetical protein